MAKFKEGDIVEVHGYDQRTARHNGWDGVQGKITGKSYDDGWNGKNQPWYEMELYEHSPVKPPGTYATKKYLSSWPVEHLRPAPIFEAPTPETHEID